MATHANSLSEYLEQLPGTSFKRLYQQPSTTFAIFRRMLPKLGNNPSPRSRLSMLFLCFFYTCFFYKGARTGG